MDARGGDTGSGREHDDASDRTVGLGVGCADRPRGLRHLGRHRGRLPRHHPEGLGHHGLGHHDLRPARHLGVEPETALKKTNRKFRKRFKFIEDELNASGKSIERSTLKDMDELWNRSKSSASS